MPTQPSSAPIPNPAETLWSQSEDILLACCLFGEAQNQSYEAKVAVACVVRNRVKRNLRYMGGASYSGVILHPMQFDAFNANDPNRVKLLRPLSFAPRPVWEECYRAAMAVYHDNCEDSTGGALFYFSPPIKEPPRAWGQVEFCAKYDDLQFYKPTPPAIEAQAA